MNESYLIFRLGDDRLAMSVRQVREILDGVNLPEMDGDALLGSVPHRDRHFPAMDLRRKLGYETDGAKGPGAYIIVDTAEPGKLRELALGVDDVVDVAEIALRNLADVPSFSGANDLHPCEKIIDDGAGLVVAVDATKLIGKDERDALENMEGKS